MADNRRPPQQQQQRPQQQPAQKKPDRLDEVRTLVSQRMIPSIKMLLGKRSHDELERFAKVFINVVEFNPDLLKCTDASLARAMMHSAEVDLEVGGAYPHAYLIPYKNNDTGRVECQFQISVWGYVELVRRSGEIKKVWADVIYSGDVYETVSGTAGKSIVHRPNWFATRKERGTVLGSYACALLENGETVFEPVSWEELQEARAANRGRSPAWDKWPEQQYQKVALKRLQKYLPKGTRAERALEIDEDPGTRGIIDVEGVPVDAPAQGPLDRAVEQHRAEQQVQQTQGGSQTTLDREALFGMLCDADERWKSRRALVDRWDEIEALSALAFLRTILGDGVGIDGTPPDVPACMMLPRDAA
jgi:phage RecT family recombinase